MSRSPARFLTPGQDNGGEFGDQPEAVHHHKTIASGEPEVEQDEIGMMQAGLSDAGYGVGGVVSFVNCWRLSCAECRKG